MAQIKVMIIDDSSLIRMVLNALLRKDKDIDVVGSFASAVTAIEKIEQLQPDIISLDIEMPEMDGITALVTIKKTYPKLPVIMCSSLTSKGAAITLDALQKGASDYVTKPSALGSITESFDELGQALLYKIKGLTNGAAAVKKTVVVPSKISAPEPRAIDLVAIGISTGGPNALTELLPKLPKDLPVPILIVQHMPPVFTAILADTLSKKTLLPIKEALDGERLLPGTIYLAPGDYHMTVSRNNSEMSVHLNQEAKENYCRPAVDVLFRSLARAYGKHVLALVMTGMGQDGLLGCQEIKKEGGLVIIQDQESSVVWGMPGAVHKAQLADSIYPLAVLNRAIVECVTKKGRLL